MGSAAQDERHERFLREAEEEVEAVQRQIAAKRAELKALEEKLVVAERALAQHRGIDRGRG